MHLSRPSCKWQARGLISFPHGVWRGFPDTIICMYISCYILHIFHYLSVPPHVVPTCSNIRCKMSQDRIAFFPCFCCLSCSKQLLLMLVLEGIEAERSSIFQERSEGIDPRKLAWRLNHAHSWKESHCFQCCPVLCLLSLFCQMFQNFHAFL